jgi:hypothetical protein
MENLFEIYKEEIVKDTKIDEINLLEKQLCLPAIKHKWVARLIQQKREKNNLLKKRKELKEQVLEKIKDQIPPGIPKKALDARLDSTEEIQKIDENMQDIDIMIEYLEKIEIIFKSMSYDLRNIIDINKLETT